MRLYEYLYHITHVGNLRNISIYGLLSKSQMIDIDLSIIDISDPEVQYWRDRIEPVFGQAIHEYVPLYFNPTNPMLYRRQELRDDLVILAIPLARAMDCVYIFTDGNAASRDTQFGLDLTTTQMSDDVLRAKYWNDFPDGKRRRCAEMLVHHHIAHDHIEHVYCYSNKAQDATQVSIGCRAKIDRSMFF